MPAWQEESSEMIDNTMTYIRFSLARVKAIRDIIAAGALGVASTFAVPVYAQDYPTKPVNLVIPFAPGGGADIVGRLIGQYLGNALGQPFIVENRAGASGNIGYTYASRAPNDGYTVLLGFSFTSSCTPSLFTDVKWKSSDFEEVASFVRFALGITVNPSIPANNLQELIAYLKANPGKVSYGASGVGTLNHIAPELFKQLTGTDMVAVQYKSSGEAIPDLLAGNIQLVFDALPPYRQHVDAGKLKTLAIADTARDPTFPDVPTMSEAGLDGMSQTGYWPLLVPAGTDPAIIKRLADLVKQASDNPEFQAKVTKLKFANVYQGPETLKKMLAESTAACANVVKSAGITVK
jgi:tripartite-type tricarboxylate transporter receptor subunit TctC